MTTAEKAGVVILAVEGAFGIWSAVNPSRFTIRKFMETEQDFADIRKGFLISSILIGGLVLAVILVFAGGNWAFAIPAAVAASFASYYLGVLQTNGMNVAGI
jgi:Na+-transporting NADH:ubiquinone oxidoreductase subunit NqrB